MLDEFLTHWTVRLALLCMVARFAGALRWGGEKWWFAWSRAIWTIGCIFFLLHVVAAFHFYHHWSHADAFETTASETYRMLGIRFGEGIYFSYLFTLLWTLDVAWQWQSPQSYQARAKWLSLAVMGYLAFIAFNGAVVFEEGTTRWVGIPLTLALLAAGAMIWLRSRLPKQQPADLRRPLAEDQS